MTEPTPKRLLVFVTRNGNDDRSTIAFTLASAALSTGMDVGVFLASDGVDLVREKSWEATRVDPFQPLASLVDDFIARGGKIWSCGSCVTHRGLRQDAMRPITVSGIGQVVEWIQAGAQVVTL